MKTNKRSHLLWVLPILQFIITFLFGYYNAAHTADTFDGELLMYITFPILAIWLFIGLCYYSKKCLIAMCCFTICLLIVTMCFLQGPATSTSKFNATLLTSTIYVHYILTWITALPVGILCILLRNKLSSISKKFYVILTSFLTLLPIVFFIAISIYSRQISNQSPLMLSLINIEALFIGIHTISIVCSLLFGAILLKQAKSEYVAITSAYQFLILLVAYALRMDEFHHDMLLCMAFFIFVITMIHQLLPNHNKPSTFLDESSL